MVGYGERKKPSPAALARRNDDELAFERRVAAIDELIGRGLVNVSRLVDVYRSGPPPEVRARVALILRGLGYQAGLRLIDAADELGRIIVELQLPGLQGEAQILDRLARRAEEWVVEAPAKIKMSVGIPKPPLAGVKMVVSLNKSTGTFMRKSGLPLFSARSYSMVLIETIKKNRPYGSYSVFQAKLQQAEKASTKLTPTTAGGSAPPSLMRSRASSGVLPIESMMEDAHLSRPSPGGSRASSAPRGARFRW